MPLWTGDFQTRVEMYRRWHKRLRSDAMSLAMEAAMKRGMPLICQLRVDL